MESLEKLRQNRLEKLEKIKKLGISPYPAKGTRKQDIATALKSAGKNVQTAGRIMAIRGHGGSSFMDLVDEAGKIQVFFSKEKLSKTNQELLDLLDVGDFIQVDGKVDKTAAGQLTIFAGDFKLLTKSIRPIPATFYGLKDVETKLRKRYLDLIANPEVRNLFIKKAKFWTSVRQFLIESGFLEVETPALELIPGGADATPFITHHNAQDTDYYLRISLELYQKRLLVGGFEKIFEIGKIFRNEGIDAEHLQDYLQMEFYWAYADYETLIDFVEKYYRFIVKETFGSTKTTSGGNQLDWGKPWQKVDYQTAFQKETGLDLSKNPKGEELFKLAEKVGAKPNKKFGEGRLIDLIYKKTVRPKLIQPTLLVNHPVAVSPLAKRDVKNPALTQRVQVLAAGTEIGNGWSELNDPIDQAQRFEKQQEMRKEGDTEAQMYDEDFVEALEYGMPPAAGFGLSQRLFAVLADKPIRETVFFPTIRSEKKMTKDDALEILEELKNSPNMIKHELAVGFAMAELYDYLKSKGKDPEMTKGNWEIVGIMHDADYEITGKSLELHTEETTKKLKEAGTDQMIIDAVRGHCDKATRNTLMAKAVYAVDELTGLIVAAALVRPDKKLESLTVESVMKRFRETSFAKGANRDQIKTCETELGIPLEEFVSITLKAMQEKSNDLGL